MTETLDNQSAEIARNFATAAEFYDKHADLQKRVADRLASSLRPWQYSVPDGPVLEFGAGTGFFTTHLADIFPERKIVVTDISSGMIEFCRSKFKDRQNLVFETVGAEELLDSRQSWALICGSFAAQWFDDPGKTLCDLTQNLLPGGYLLASMPGSESFPNWINMCLELGLPFTANQLPDIERTVLQLSEGPVQVDFYEDNMSDSFPSVIDFFRHLKLTGTSFSKNDSSLTPKQLKILDEHWTDQTGKEITVQYHTAFIAAKKDL